jgi:hypothetical protein
MGKRRNHEVPKGLLKNWLGSEGSDEGLHHIDLADGELRFEKGREAKFAITEHLYVPERVNGGRDDALENWFSIDENGLAPFARSAAAGTLATFTSEKLINQAIRACIALGYRSAYGMFMAMSVLEPLTASRHEAAVANVVRSIGQKFRVFSTWQFLVLYDLPVPLLISERPFQDFTPRGLAMVAMPLGPRALMLGRPPDHPSGSKMQLGVGPAAPEHQRIAKMHSQASIKMARQWVVAESRAELKAVQSELTPEKVLTRRRTDRVILSGVGA